MATIKSLIVLLAVVFYICVTGVKCAEEEKNSTVVLSPNSTSVGNSSVSQVVNATSPQVRALRSGERQGRCQIVWQWIKALFSPTDTTKSSGDSLTKKTGNSKKFLLSPETSKDKSSTRDTDEEKDNDREARGSLQKMRQNRKLKPLTYELPW